MCWRCFAPSSPRDRQDARRRLAAQSRRPSERFRTAKGRRRGAGKTLTPPTRRQRKQRRVGYPRTTLESTMNRIVLIAAVVAAFVTGTANANTPVTPVAKHLRPVL